jgi:DNA-binding SARP family transcriptional activator
MQFGVLGPVRVAADDGTQITIGAPKLRLLAAALLCRPNQPVGTSALVDELWGSPTRRGAENLRVYVHHLRRVLGEARVHHHPNGYRLVVCPDELDAARFHRLLGEARGAAERGDLPQASKAFRLALALWRGPAFADLDEGALVRAEANALDELRLDATEESVEVELSLGRHAALCAELRALSAQHPLRERLRAQLMLALFRCERQAEALAAFEEIRRLLADELGLDPGARLRELHERILRGEQGLYGTTCGRPTASAVAPLPPGQPGRLPVVPRQLPTDISAFTGRADLLRQLDALLSGDREHAISVVITAIAGTAGIGKTSLAVHWAYRVADKFSDGQLYVNMRGFHPNDQVMTPAEAVRGFLDALGVPPQRIPPDIDAQTALYRSLLAGKRILVVLDNVRDADQARPLLPGTPTAMTLVTSRTQLTPLVAVEGAQPLTIDVLPTAEARELLVERLGAARVANEPDAVEDIIAKCAGLPLALAIVASRAQMTTFPLSAFAAELTEAGQRLDALHGGDAVTDIRSVFSWSYTTLTPPAARLFRLLGLHPGPDLSTAAAASLASHSRPEVRQLLTELTRANLLTEHVPGRYTFHDLLRSYAIDLSRTHDSADKRAAANERMLSHYLCSAQAADRILYQSRDPLPLSLTPPVAGVRTEEPAEHNEAMSWLTAEHRVLLALLRRAADTGAATPTFQLAWVLDTYLQRRGHWHERTAAWQLALSTSGSDGDQTARAHAHRHLADTYGMLHRYADAHAHYRYANDLFEAVGHPSGQAQTHHNLAYLWTQQGHHDKALDHARLSLALFGAAEHRRGQGYALHAIGWCQAQVGNHTDALTYCEQALPLLEEVGDRRGQALAWDSLGYIHRHLGDHARAATCYRRSLDFARYIGDRHQEAVTLHRLGDTHKDAGDTVAARAAWTQALAILSELNHPDAEDVHTKLNRLGMPTQT